jgi:hypothetical protein
MKNLKEIYLLRISWIFRLKKKKIKNEDNFKNINSQTVKSSQIKKSFVSNVENSLNFRQFTSHIPSWGGVIEIIQDDLNNDYSLYKQYNNLEFMNTCTIDYFLFAIWCVSKVSSESIKCLNILANENQIARYLIKIIDLIDTFQWNRARSLWILPILQLKPENWKFSLFGQQSTFFVNKCLQFQEIVFKCTDCEFDLKTINEYYFKRNDSNELIINCVLDQPCNKCKNKVYGRFETVPFWIFVSIFDAISFTDLPPSIAILNKTFNLLCFSFATSHNSVPHFKVFFICKKCFTKSMI